MRLAYLATHERYFGMAEKMIASARSVMPGIRVIHLADAICPAHESADEVMRAPEGMEFGATRMHLFSQIEGECISADVDLIFQRDVWHVFDRDFDMAAASRIGTKWGVSVYSEVMPINNGILWSRSPDFWKVQASGYDRLPKQWRKWGEQLLFNNVFLSGEFKALVLPCEYNFPPEEGDDLSKAHVLHFKGKRKKLMGA